MSWVRIPHSPLADLAQWIEHRIKKESCERFLQLFYIGDSDVVGSIPAVGYIKLSGGKKHDDIYE